ncbi:LOW QUALITY PROTEIN: hypothetical protein PFAG_00690 [Plasmodium falciparum Santa Lucia]|uniref:Uncharacterized protein n=1 Tax=Plasmodium falciparum Santa Lucia TaxID=478859 RepID=W7G465_PLAFA|nr:LOW QUALITY PROTEIN: hypothetical protein PFAG_00690 [Plasmodium falciparum Santa Lucia]
MKLYKNFIKKLRRPPPGNSAARSATFLRKLSASGVEPTFSQGKVTYLTTGLLGQLNNSSDIKEDFILFYNTVFKHNICYHLIYYNISYLCWRIMHEFYVDWTKNIDIYNYLDIYIGLCSQGYIVIKIVQCMLISFRDDVYSFFYVILFFSTFFFDVRYMVDNTDRKDYINKNLH